MKEPPAPTLLATFHNSDTAKLVERLDGTRDAIKAIGTRAGIPVRIFRHGTPTTLADEGIYSAKTEQVVRPIMVQAEAVRADEAHITTNLDSVAPVHKVGAAEIARLPKSDAVNW